MTRARAAALVVAACLLVAADAPTWAGTPYDPDSGRDLERAAVDVEYAQRLPDVERPAGSGAGEDAARAAAAEDPELAQALQQLRAPEWIDRLTGVYALQRMGSAAAPAASQVALLLEDGNGGVRLESAECLFRIGAPAVPLLVATLASRDVDARALAARTLGRIGLDARDAVPVLQAMHDDPSADVAEQVSFALPLIAPQGPRDWLWKIGFEIGDEPWGIPALFGAFAALVLGNALWSLRRSGRVRRTRFPGAAKALEASTWSRSPEDASLSAERTKRATRTTLATTVEPRLSVPGVAPTMRCSRRRGCRTRAPA